ncbi:ABC transporter permease [Magnetofaba australis]|uniref:Transport permease protein n=1 Tax=Magnetofaba australis IT-1 TaxID=1434232 RepID=A0A1Y2K4D6_9PROT|nr:ABC transporter permease [Magnetofaba australis]OSM01905.1 putative ABC transporter [Magnetofaba australis IT-1]
MIPHWPIIRAMAWRQIATRYTGSGFGVAWEALHPLLLIGVYYMVFAQGLKLTGPDGGSYLLYFICGMTPWMMMSQLLTQAPSSIRHQGSLVRKTPFPIATLPFIHLLAGGVSHLLMLGLVILMLALLDAPLSLSSLQLLYYFAALCALLIGLFWLISALSLFFRDLEQIVPVLVNIVFWLTPVVWPANLAPEALRGALAYNPAFYIVEGYRNALLYERGFWNEPQAALRFWLITLLLMAVGYWIFKRLQPHFADVI